MQSLERISPDTLILSNPLFAVFFNQPSAMLETEGLIDWMQTFHSAPNGTMPYLHRGPKSAAGKFFGAHTPIAVRDGQNDAFEVAMEADYRETLDDGLIRCSAVECLLKKGGHAYHVRFRRAIARIPLLIGSHETVHGISVLAHLDEVRLASFEQGISDPSKATTRSARNKEAPIAILHPSEPR